MISGLPDNTHRFTKPNYRYNIYGFDFYCVNHDIEFIRQQLQQVRHIENAWFQLKSDYNSTFVAEYKQEANEAAKEGTARRAANIQLRHNVEQLLKNRLKRAY
ncbi:hypothetical protein [Pseudoalteromonas sp.]|uniref:hypothetical protein n=1 Tax=Pseudoalteromonas sp. TaxID=53249 RepID=UPI003561E9FE